MKSWNEIRKAATAFSKRRKDAYDEKSQAQNFLREFFELFGVDVVVINALEHRVKFTDGSQGYVDCFWQGKILIEMKSRGKDLAAKPAELFQALMFAAATPTLFREQKNPKSAIIIPKVSSEKRDYIPIGFIDDSVIVTDLAFIIPDANLYHFGIPTSRMHNAWMRAVAGRLKSDYRYSKDIVYNNFIWPVDETTR